MNALRGRRLPSAFTPAAAPPPLTWLCASWPAGTPRLRHMRRDRLDCMSGSLLALSLSLTRASRTSVHRESLHLLSLEVVWRYTCGLTFGFFCTSALSVLLLKKGLSVHLGLLLAGLAAASH